MCDKLNRKALAVFLVLIVLTSGPLFTPLANASAKIGKEKERKNIIVEVNGTKVDLGPMIKIGKSRPIVSLSTSYQNNESPFPVKFVCNVERADRADGVLVYLWDFDGDGLSDRSTYDQNEVLHVYETRKDKVFNASVTVGFVDGSYEQATQSVKTRSINQRNWVELREIGQSKIGISINGSIIVYDENSWLPLTFSEPSRKLSDFNISSNGKRSRVLSYPSYNGVLNVTISYGIAGKAQLQFEELTPSGLYVSPMDKKVKLPKEKANGNLKFKYSEESKKNLDIQKSESSDSIFYDALDLSPRILGLSFSTLPLILQSNYETPQPVVGSGLVLGEVGADHNPWNDQGITPYGEYFENNQEYVSMHTGFLTITSNDLSIPGRGIDLNVKRVYAPPVAFEGHLPASSTDYSYQNYPWAPLGNGWMLGFPWIELDGSNPAYIILSNGQRYAWNGLSTDGTEYHSGDRFTLYGHANGNVTLYTIDGTRYDYDSDYVPRRITDLNGNKIIFHYTNNKITTITDTIGRNTTLAYNGNGLLSNITSGERVTSYSYEEGVNTGYRLTSATDPIGRVSEYEYFDDFMINKTKYPTGGSTWYTYSIFEDEGYRKYRVSGQSKFPGEVPVNSTIIELDQVKNIQVLDKPYEYGYVHAFDFEGDTKYTNSTFMWLWWRWMSGYIHLYKGYLEWDIERIPDDADLTEFNYFYDCFDCDGDATASISEMVYRPSLSNASVLYDDISDGSFFDGDGDFPLYGNYRYIDLNDAAKTDFEDQLDDDWFAIGISRVSSAGGSYPNGDGLIEYCQFDTGSNAEPRGTLQIIYDDPVEVPYVEGATYLSFDFDSTFYHINNTIIKNSDGVDVKKTTRLDYKQNGFTETVWDGTTSDPRLYLKNTKTDETRRRTRIEHYPSTSTISKNQTIRYDSWGNTHYTRDFEDHDSYFSYSNTDSENQFNDTNGDLVTDFSDSFYTNSIPEYVHNLLLGKAEYQNGVGSSKIESYYKYDSNCNLIESKNLLSPSWVTSEYDYDTYGNLVKVTDPRGNQTYYEYNSTYQNAYLTKYHKELLSDTGNVNLTKQYRYDSVTGKLQTSVDELGNRTDYRYDIIGRIMNITYPLVNGKRCSERAEYNDTEVSVSIYDANSVKVKKYFDGLGKLVLQERYSGDSVYTNESYIYNWMNEVETHILPTGLNYTYHYNALGHLYQTDNPDGTITQNVRDYIYNTQTTYDEEGRKKVYYYDMNDRLTEVREFNDTECYLATFYEYDEVGNLVNLTNGVYFKPVEYIDYFYSLADCYVKKRFPDNSYPTGYLYVKEGENSYWRNSFIYFDTSSLPIDCTITKATLSLFCNTVGGDSPKSVSTQCQRVAEPWFEHNTTYNNQPGISTSGMYTKTVDSTTDNMYNNWSIPNIVQYWANNPEHIYGVKIRSSINYGDNYYSIISRDYTDKPQLEVKYEAYTKFGQQRTTEYIYDQLGRVTRIDYPDSGYEAFTYDGSSNLVSKRDLNGNTTEYVYDSLNRLLEEQYANGHGGVYEYDEIGNLVSSTNNGTITNLSYDARNRVIQESVSVSNWNVSPKLVDLTWFDGFESGSFSAWNGTAEQSGIDLNINSTVTKTGNYSARCNGSGIGKAYYYKNLDDSTNLTISFDVLFNTLPSTISGQTPLIQIDEMNVFPETVTQLVIADYWGQGTVFGASNSSSYTQENYSDILSLNTTTWYNLVLNVVRDDIGGQIRVWLDDDLIIDLDDLDTYRSNDDSRVSVGVVNHWSEDVDLHIDNVQIDRFDVPIPPPLYNNYTVGYEYNNVSSVIEQSYPDSDDLIFSSDFESGDLSDWSYQFVQAPSSFTVQSNLTCSGDYALQINRTSGTMYNVIELNNISYSSVEFDIYFDSLPGFAWQEYYRMYDSGDNLIHRLLIGVSGGYNLYLNADEQYSSPFNVTTGKWYHFKIETIKDDYNGSTCIWVDGEELISAHNMDTDAGYPYEAIQIGLWSCPTPTSIIYLDNFQVKNNPSLRMEYDELNRLKSLSGYADFEYTITDQIDSIEYANGVSTEYTYDSRDRPITILTQKDTTTHLNLTYGYDKTGSVTSINNGTYTETYTYDKVDRLSSTTGPWGTIDYTYDPVGNRLSKATQGGSTTTYTYDSMDRMLTATGMGFDWDANGNMLYRHDGSNAWNYTYNPVNRLTRVEKDSVLSAVYTYDADGRRVRTWDTVDGIVDYVYSGLNIIDEVSGKTHEKHIYAGMMHIASNTNGTIEYYHVDHLGSTRLKTAANGSAIYESNYEPFGPSSGENGDEDYRYTGKHEDPTGLYYYGARYYDPVTGRFTTRDTVMGDLSGPQTLNRYIYCMNNPHKYTDPDGRFAHIVAGAAVGSFINAGMYTFSSIISGADLSSTSFKRGLAGAAVSGAVSGGLGAALGPMAIFNSGLGKVAADIAVEGLAYVAETVVSGGKFSTKDAIANIGSGLIGSVASDNLIRGTKSMNTFDQAQYFTPTKPSTYVDAFLNHPDASRNAAAILNQESFSSFIGGSLSNCDLGLSSQSSAYATYEQNRI